MKHRTPSQEEIEEFITALQDHIGRENAIVARDLVDKMNLGNEGARRLRALAHEANEQGYLVCSGDAGYFIARDPDEVEETIGRIESQATEMFNRARQLRAIAAKRFGEGTQIGLGL